MYVRYAIHVVTASGEGLCFEIPAKVSFLGQLQYAAGRPLFRSYGNVT